MNPILYRYICTTSSNLLTLPLDIAQTKIIAPQNTSFNLDELKWLALFLINMPFFTPVILKNQIKY